MGNTRDSPSGKMSPEHSAQIKDEISVKRSSPSATSEGEAQYLNLKYGNMPGSSWETVSVLHGDNTTRNFGECPNDAKESTVLSILQANVPDKYYLSPRAAQGIMNRAKRRGKIIPTTLMQALMFVVSGGSSEELGGALDAKTYDARGNGDGFVTGTLVGDHQNRVTDYTYLAIELRFYRYIGMGSYVREGGASSTVLARDYKSATDLIVNHDDYVYTVRRLTPTECLRLQGLPDWWCDGVDKTDTNVYKMAGNGIAIPCAYDVLNKIAMEYERSETHRSVKSEGE